jgi:hypothetical protein
MSGSECPTLLGIVHTPQPIIKKDWPKPFKTTNLKGFLGG